MVDARDMAQPITYPISDALEKATGKSGQELVSLMAQHLMHVGRRGNSPHQLPPLLGANQQHPNQKSHSRSCSQCEQAADLVKLIEQSLLQQQPAPVAAETQENK
jgi:hypothetical protein